MTHGLFLICSALLLCRASACCKAKFLATEKINRSLEVGQHENSTHNAINKNRQVSLAHVPARLRTALHMQLGVRTGGSVNFLASLTGNATRWDGFDSFAGMPTTHGLSSALSGWKAGRLTTHGTLPAVLPNVALHKGWFNESVPPFLDAELRASNGSAAVAYLDMDADIYVSTHDVFEAVFSRCMHRNGTVITFDELFGTAAILAHEWRALLHAQRAYNFTFEFISYALVPSSPFARASVQLRSCGTPHSECARKCNL